MLETIGLDAELARSAAPWAAAADVTLGRVALVDHGLVSVLTEDGPRRASLGGGLLARVAVDATEAPCAGDWCLLQEWPDHCSTVERILPRRTAVFRGEAAEQCRGQLLCSNIDIAAVVVALHPVPVPCRVEQLVARARRCGARPLVVLTKGDLVAAAATAAADVAAATPGVDVMSLSARTGQGMQALRDRAEARLTLGLVGAPGHGRTSLATALAGGDVLTTHRTASVRRQLLLLPGGGAVIDTPGPDGRRDGPGRPRAGAGLLR